MTAIAFESAEIEYLAWVQQNPNSFVVNSRAEFDPAYIVLHRSSCPSVLKYPKMKSNPGGFTERGYVKVCAHTVAELTNHFGPMTSSAEVFSKFCGMCKPA